MLRVAVRCFTSANGQDARYTDSHAWTGIASFGFSDLVAGCTDYLASAHWKMGADEFQAQCFRSDAGLVPDCVDPTAAELADLDERFLLYTLISPAAGKNSCGGADSNRTELRSLAHDLAYEGVLSGRYLCAKDPAATDWVACDDPLASVDVDRGQYGLISGFKLASQGRARVIAAQPLDGGSGNPVQGFNNCCDYEHTLDLQKASGHAADSCFIPDGGPPNGLCSPVDASCASAVVFGVCRGGASCASPGAAFLPFKNARWFGPRLHAHPGDGPLAETDPDVAGACFRFSFEDSLRVQEPGGAVVEDFRTAAFRFSDPPPAAVPASCDPPDLLFDDRDLDGIYDDCDLVVASRTLADGVQAIRLRNRIRNQGFSQPFDDNTVDGAVDEVRIGAQPVSLVTRFTDDVKVVKQEIRCGRNLVVNSTLAPPTDDVVVIPLGGACSTPDTVVIRPGPNAVLESPIVLDDFKPIVLTCGPNGRADSKAHPSDIQLIFVGNPCASDAEVVSSGDDLLMTLDGSFVPAELVGTIPLLSVLNPTGNPIEWESSSGLVEPSPQPFVPVVLGYLADGTANGVRGFDALTERLTDVHPSADSNLVNLNCNPADAIGTVQSPQGFAARRVATGLPSPNQLADREVFLVSDVVTSSGSFESRLFGFDVEEHRVLKADGVLLPGMARALDVTPDLLGVDRAYVALRSGSHNGQVAVVDVDPDSALRWQVDPAGPLFPGVPAAIRVRAAGLKVTAYITSVECSPGGGLVPQCELSMPEPASAMEGLSEGVGGPPFWCIEDCNGGSQSWRKVLLSRLDVTDPESIVVECSQVLSGITVMNQCDSSTVFPNVGLAFSLDGTKLFVVGPDDGLLRVVDTASGAVTEVIGMGPTAVDVAVVRTAGTLGEERAYVLNHGNRTAGIIDVASLTVDGLPIDLNPFGNPSPFFTAITALSNGTKLFVADKANGLLTMVDLDTNFPHDILAGEMKTGNAPRRVFLLRAP